MWDYVTELGDTGKADFDRIAEVWFDTVEDCQAAAESSLPEAYKAIHKDEERFMD